MPLPKMQAYQVEWTGPDGPHISGAISMKATNPKEALFVQSEITRAMKPATEEFPDGNPDIVITKIGAVASPEVVYAAAQKLKEENPDRVGADELGLDTPNRVLHHPEILRNLAAEKIPG